jgi:hypothetical protein
MGPNLPLSVRLGPRPPAIVVDATFALSRMGLLVTAALARTANVWLPRGLYTLLDNDSHYRRAPDQMGAGWIEPEIRAAMLREMAEELESWRRAWLNGKLSSRVHWVADARYESALPDREENGLLPRFESCCAALDARHPDLAALAAPLDECTRDVIALSAALQPDPAFILTMSAPAGGVPPLCDYLAKLDIQVRPSAAGMPDWTEAAFGPALAPLAAAGCEAAIVQIAAPVILALPDSWSEEDWEPDDGAPILEGAPDDLWRNACALWRPLAPLKEAA